MQARLRFGALPVDHFDRPAGLCPSVRVAETEFFDCKSAARELGSLNGRRLSVTNA